MRDAPRQPVIIIGMHRSGTSMLTRTMQGFGFFMGRGTTRNEECRWTNQLNYWVFRQASATWERPEGVDALFSAPQLRALVEDYLQGVVAGPSSGRYLGFRRWLRYRSMCGITEPWGWKDPRNTYTLPVWLKVFPEARVLHIMRHGVDVAQSLRVRHQHAADSAAERYRQKRWFYVNSPFAPKKGGFAHSPRVGVLEGGFSLWEAYTTRARAQVTERGTNALELRYEDLLKDPLPHLRKVVDFCGLDAPESRLRAVAQHFQPDRAFAYRQDPELCAFAERVEERLQVNGYAPTSAAVKQC